MRRGNEVWNIGLLLLLIVFGPTGCALLGLDDDDATRLSASELMAAGDKWQAGGRPDMALAYYDKALAAGGPAAALNLKKGDAFLSRQEYGPAAKAYTTVLAKEPGNARALAGAGECGYRLQDDKAAEVLLRKAAEVDPSLPKPHMLLGDVYNRGKRFDQALGEYALAAKAGGDPAEVLNGRGVAFFGLGRYQEALDSFEDALRYAPGSKPVYANMAATLGRMKKYDLALECLRKVEDEATAHYDVACLLFNDDRAGEAATHLEKAISLNPSGSAKYKQMLAKTKAAAQASKGRPSGARGGIADIGTPIGGKWVPENSVANGSVLSQQPAASKVPAPKKLQEATLHEEAAPKPEAQGGETAAPQANQGQAAGQAQAQAQNQPPAQPQAQAAPAQAQAQAAGQDADNALSRVQTKAAHSVTAN